jgi:hypothetical protein
MILAINQVIGRNSLEDNDDNNETTSLSSNLGCFLCTQLLSVTQHQVGLSETQLKSVLDKKCTFLPDKYQVLLSISIIININMYLLLLICIYYYY